ncbi:ABC transporter permease [Endozoicomonas ascidiicola]|uniref:ABC transporter permease n=1 Tax=Endozoicomonas ascidiicola TaxID=1698521 RepID=UPI0008306B41|nr:ABC transporter permease [Endozoicomonas ascidiicola]
MDATILSWGDSGWGDEFFFATLMTLAVASCSFLLGLVIAIAAAAMKLSKRRSLTFFANVYTTVVRGIPELLVIYLIFYGSSVLLMSIANSFFGIDDYIELPVFVMGVICIGLSSGAYSTEVIRGAVQAVPVGTIEAAKAIGMPTFSRFRRILAPQAIRFALPGLGNVWQLTLKETSLISVIGLTEIVRIAQMGAGSEKKPFLFFITGLILFLVLASLSDKGYKFLEAKAEKGVRVN